MEEGELFEKEVDKAYDILWALYRPKNNAEEGCNFSLKYEDKLLAILNFIDNMLER